MSSKAKPSNSVPPEPAFLSRRTPRSVAAPGTDWMPLPAIIAILFVGLIGYFVAEASLASYPHPLHWLATVAIGLFGYAGGLIWHRARGF